MDILKDLFDEKIIETLDFFLENSDKKLCLSEVSEGTKINLATTYRIINKLLKKEFISETKVGKTKVYRIANNEKTRALEKLLKKDTGPLHEFTSKASILPSIEKIILESKDKDSAKLIIVSDNISSKTIEPIANEQKKNNFRISYVIISSEQYDGLKTFNFELDKKIIYEKN